MASEIRVNRLSNRSGLSTITFANGGVQFSGITTFANGDFRVGTGATILNPSTNEMQFHTGGSSRLTINNSGATIGALTATTGTFSSNVSIGGVLTYEDVKNVDSTGIVTARSGAEINGGDLKVGTAVTFSAVTGNVTQDVGITTFSGSATWFKGLTANKDMYWSKSSGSLVFKDNSAALFGTSSDLQIYHSSSDNNSYIIEGGSGSLMIQGDVVNIGNVGSTKYYIRAFEDGAVQLRYAQNTKLETDNDGIRIGSGGGDNTIVDLYNASYDNGVIQYYNGSINLKTGSSNGDRTFQVHTAGSERLRITSSGQVSISSDGTADGLLTIKGDSDQVGTPSIRLLDGSDTREVSITNTSGDFVVSVHGNDNAIHGHIKMFESGIFDINNGGASGSNVNRLRIDSSGRLGLKTTAMSSYNGSGDDVVIDNGAADVGVTLDSETQCSFAFTDSAKTGWDGWIKYVHSDNHLEFGAGAGERLRITSTGRLGLGIAAPTKLLDIAASTSSDGIRIKSTGNTYNELSFDANRTSANTHLGRIISSWNGTAVSYISFDAGSDTTNKDDGLIRFWTANGSGNFERLRIHSDGKISTGGITNPTGCFEVNTGAGSGQANTLALRRASTNDYSAVSFFTGTTCDWSVGQNNAGDFEIFEDGADSTTRLSVHTGGTVQVQNHLTSRNGIVQINQVTTTTRWTGTLTANVIEGSSFTPKTSDPRFLIMIFCPVNTSDDSDAANQNTNPYYYGRIEYQKNGGSWIECNNQGSTSNQGGSAAHIELSPNRTGDGTTDYWTGNRYRMEHKQATILATNVGDCGSSGNVKFKLRVYAQHQNFLQIGQPHGYSTDDNYPVQPWGFTVFELAPDSNSYTAY